MQTCQPTRKGYRDLPRPKHNINTHPVIQQGLTHANILAASRDWSGVVEAVANIAILDIQQHQQAFLASAYESRMLCEVYASAFRGAGLHAIGMMPKRRAKRRVGLVISQLIATQAAATSLVRWAEILSSSSTTVEHWEPIVIVTDELSERNPPLPQLARPSVTSRQIGADLIKRLSASGVTTHVMSIDGTFLDGARAGIDLARGLDLDIACFVASPACPIQAGMAHARVAPVQINMNIGVPLPIDGMDAIIYHNDIRADGDATVLAALGIEQHRIITIGTDLRSCQSVTPFPRSELSVPDDAVLLCNAANVLPKRMLFDGFANDLCAFMQRNPNVWWLGIGAGDLAPLGQVFAKHGVHTRTALTGARTDIRPFLAAADILLNEYPEGGGNTVLEAMGCGTPVVAMHAGTRHAECIGAILTGNVIDAITDRSTYWRIVQQWVDSVDDRRNAGRAMKKRAFENFDYAPIVRKYETIFHAMLTRARS